MIYTSDEGPQYNVVKYLMIYTSDEGSPSISSVWFTDYINNIICLKFYIINQQ